MELRRGSLFANLLTIGNGVCGFAALIKLSQLQLAEDNTPTLRYGGELLRCLQVVGGGGW